MKIEFYEPPMCCPTGVCGTSVDEKLVKVSENINNLKSKYPLAYVGRYMITQQPLKFKENEEVYKLVKEKGKEVLPIVTVNDKIIKVSDYPTLEEIEKAIGDE